jgi:hypothetical protein
MTPPRPHAAGPPPAATVLCHDERMTVDTTPRLRRVLIAELDSLAQRDLESRLGRAATEQHLVGALRAAHLLAGTVLVTDSMLLDSRFFSSVGPRELAARLGTEVSRLPLSIVSKEGSLRTALAAKLADEEFVWQLDDDRPLRSWHAWIAAEEAGYVAAETFTSFDHAGGPIAKPDFVAPPPLRTRSEHPVVAEFVERAGSAEAKRSSVYADHRAARSTVEQEHQDELDRLHREWNLHYLQAMATQHHASWITFEPELTAALTADGHLAGPKTLTISGRLHDLISDAPPAVYAQMRFAARHASDRFKEDPTARNLRSLAFALDSSTSSPGLRASAFGAIASLVLAVLGLGFGVLDSLGGLSKWWTTVVVVLAGLVTFPWAAVPIFRATRSKHVTGLLAIGSTS